jgi:hypothetical protein
MSRRRRSDLLATVLRAPSLPMTARLEEIEPALVEREDQAIHALEDILRSFRRQWQYARLMARLRREFSRDPRGPFLESP